MKVRKPVLPRTMAEHINIRLKLVTGNLVNLVELGLKLGWNHSGLCVLRRRQTTRSVCRYIIAFAHQQIVMVDGQLWVFIILSPKCTKIITFLQITPKPENILKRLQNGYKVFKSTYIPWNGENPWYTNTLRLTLLLVLKQNNEQSL